MKRKITYNELRQIRSRLNSLLPKSKSKVTLFVSVILPEPCDKETLDFAHYFCNRLRKVNCEASISELMQFPYREIPKKNFEVLPDKPLGIPCIRVFPKPKQEASNSQQRIGRTVSKWWNRLFSSSENGLQKTA